MKIFFTLLLSLVLFSCGDSEVELVFVETGGEAQIDADFMKIEAITPDYGKIGIIWSKGTILKAKMNFYRDNALVASFPIKVQANGTGLTASFPLTVHTVQIKMENVSGKPISELLGTFEGSREGIGVLYGKSHMVVRNGFDVKMQIIQEKSPLFDFDYSYVKVKLVPQDTQARAWNAVLNMPDPDHSAF